MSHNPILKRIADRYMLHGLPVHDIGLMEGKTGMSLFFFLYARQTGNGWYEAYAGELLDEVFNRLSNRIPVTFADGLCGVGWSIEFLKAQGFVEGDTDEILSDVDCKIMERDPRRMNDFTLESGLEGIAVYVRSRLDSPRPADNAQPFDPDYLDDLSQASGRGGIDWRTERYAPESVWANLTHRFSSYPPASWQWGLYFMTHHIK